MLLDDKQKARFDSTLKRNCLVNPITKCWEWIGSGWYQILQDHKMRQPHRLSAAVYKDFDIDSKLNVYRLCENDRCINPEHLIINKINAKSKKISEEQMIELYDLYFVGVSEKDLAEKFKVSRQHINAILWGKRRSI